MSSVQQQTLLSPAELAYLHTSLSFNPPVRPDGRSATQFRPLTAETGILPGTNGSARVCFSDGTEAIVGVKAELEKTSNPYGGASQSGPAAHEDDGGAEGGDDAGRGRNEWLEMTIEIPGLRDDEASTVFLGTLLSEAVLADGEFAKKLYINRRFHWKLYLDVLLISPPLSYPLPLLSITTHLALLATRLPKLKSEGDEDPMFDDDWQSSTFLYPRDGRGGGGAVSGDEGSRPPITLLVIAIQGNIIFDPSKEELAAAESALAISVSEVRTSTTTKPAAKDPSSRIEVDSAAPGEREIRLLSVRTIDPPSRLTPAGVPNSENPATGAGAVATKKVADTDTADRSWSAQQGVWRPILGGIKLAVLEDVIDKTLERGGVADEILDALDGVELG